MDFFDATKVQPSQGGTAHPPGRFPFTITNTYAKENSAKDGAMLVVEFTSDTGRIENRYNIWNKSEKAVEIAQKELSALCHATSIFRITFPRDAQGNYDMANAARELRGGRGVMEIAPQVDKEGKPNGYVELKKVFDSAGNEPGKSGAAPQTQPAQPQQQPQPNNGGWGGAAPAPTQQAQQGQAQPAWGAAQPAQQAQPQQAAGWSPGPAQGGQTPPWGSK